MADSYRVFTPALMFLAMAPVRILGKRRGKVAFFCAGTWKKRTE
jgi:hypothetical protein